MTVQEAGTGVWNSVSPRPLPKIPCLPSPGATRVIELVVAAPEHGPWTPGRPDGAPAVAARTLVPVAVLVVAGLVVWAFGLALGRVPGGTDKGEDDPAGLEWLRGSDVFLAAGPLKAPKAASTITAATTAATSPEPITTHGPRWDDEGALRPWEGRRLMPCEPTDGSEPGASLDVTRLTASLAATGPDGAAEATIPDDDITSAGALGASPTSPGAPRSWPRPSSYEAAPPPPSTPPMATAFVVEVCGGGKLAST